MCVFDQFSSQDANFGETSSSIAPSAVAQILPDVAVSAEPVPNSNANPTAQNNSAVPANVPPPPPSVSAGINEVISLLSLNFFCSKCTTSTSTRK